MSVVEEADKFAFIGVKIIQLAEKIKGTRPHGEVFSFEPLRPPTNKSAPQDCEAFGAENETQTTSCNTLIISDL